MVAAPAFREIAEAAVRYLSLPPREAWPEELRARRRRPGPRARFLTRPPPSAGPALESCWRRKEDGLVDEGPGSDQPLWAGPEAVDDGGPAAGGCRRAAGDGGDRTRRGPDERSCPGRAIGRGGGAELRGHEHRRGGACRGRRRGRTGAGRQRGGGGAESAAGPAAARIAVPGVVSAWGLTRAWARLATSTRAGPIGSRASSSVDGRCGACTCCVTSLRGFRGRTVVRGDPATSVRDVRDDSRRVEAGDLFVAVPGTQGRRTRVHRRRPRARGHRRSWARAQRRRK